MNPSRPNISPKLISLNEAARQLGVSVNTLLSWNEFNILKPTITNTGEVGYREEQINQFLIIQKQLPTNQSDYVSASIHKSYFPDLIMPILSFSAITISLIVIFLTKQYNPPVSPNETGTSGTVLSSQISKSDLPNTSPPPLDIQPTSPELPNFQSASINPQLDYNLIANNFNYGQSANFNSIEDTPSSVFDDGGNIKGNTTNADVLAASINANGTIQTSNPIKQTTDLNILVALVVMSGLSLPFLFKKQPVLNTKNSKYADVQLYDPIGNLQEEKILEVNQKTDGTVVLCFEGQEHKVCKPELDSESDQFIERLMGLVTSGTKEVDYDSNQDSEIKLSAPLSKLVTRLGFVGIKRDLFFPRTSKNRVLFRKYITKKDLSSMNLNPSQITSNFLNSN